MRFRLGLNQQGQGAEGFGRGFSNLAQSPIQAILAADQAQQDAAKQQLMSSQMGAHAASARLSDAHAALFNQQRQQAESVPGQLDLGLAARTGVDLPTINAWRTQMTTGKTPTATVPGDPTADAPMQDGAVQLPGLDKSVMQRIATEYSQLLPAYTNPDKFKVDDLAQARGLYQKQGAIDAIFANPGQAPAVGQAYAATEGKPLVDNVGNTGRSFNRFTGAGGTIDPGLAALFDQGELAQVGLRDASARHQDAAAGASKASAAASYASARQHDAATGKIKADMDRDRRTGSLQVITDAEGNVQVLDKNTRVVQPALGPDGQPVKKTTPADKPMPEGAQKQVVGARNVQDAVDNYLAKLQDFGLTDMASPTKRAIMGSAYNNMMLQAKEAYNLGVLNGPDYEILQSVVADPTKWTSAFKPNEALAAQAGELKRIAKGIEAQVLRAHNKPVPQAAPPAAPAAPVATKGPKITNW